MKPRRVMIQLEVETDAPLPALRKADAYAVELSAGTGREPKWYALHIIQAQANVVEPWDEKKGDAHA